MNDEVMFLRSGSGLLLFAQNKFNFEKFYSLGEVETSGKPLANVQ